MFPIFCQKKDKEEQDKENLMYFDSETEGDETEDEEEGRKKRKRAKLFILKGFLKPFRLLNQLLMFSHLIILFRIGTCTISLMELFSRKSFG